MLAEAEAGGDGFGPQPPRVYRLRVTGLLCGFWALVAYPGLQLCIWCGVVDLDFRGATAPLILAQGLMLLLPVECRLRLYMVLVNPLPTAIFGPAHWWALQPFLVSLCFTFWVCRGIVCATLVSAHVGLALFTGGHVMLPPEYWLLPREPWVPILCGATAITAAGNVLRLSEDHFCDGRRCYSPSVLGALVLCKVTCCSVMKALAKYYPVLAMALGLLAFVVLKCDLDRARPAALALEGGSFLFQAAMRRAGQRRQLEATRAAPEDLGGVCTICWGSFQLDCELVRLPCHPTHCLHRSCALQYARHSSSCPLCRTPDVL